MYLLELLLLLRKLKISRKHGELKKNMKRKEKIG
jgi:hypothetical protein